MYQGIQKDMNKAWMIDFVDLTCNMI